LTISGIRDIVIIVRIIKRKITDFVRTVEQEYPVITIVGPRQSGKTTLARQLYPDKPYFSFENPDIRIEIEDDPRGFLQSLEHGAVLDEFQRVPTITSYLQQIVDDDIVPGKFILTGSRNLEIMDQVSQSLVGRSATVELLPFSYSEIQAELCKAELPEILFQGLYPPIHHRKLTPSNWYSNYVRNYLERDVRQIINVKDLNVFHRFLILCAGRIGQLINYSDISSELGISHNTIKSWLSVLEAHYIVYFLYPFFGSQTKRIVKTPKLYFYDTGLACWLLSIHKPEHLLAHPHKGALFESFCINELLKSRYNRGERSNLYFWRDKSGHEIDVIVDKGISYEGIEIKISKTFNKVFLKNLNYLAENDKRLSQKRILWGGEESRKMTHYDLLSWKDID
jgi:uncharacterized protein